jgi:signal peptidase I
MVQVGNWYLVSDDRHLHLDSRDFGPIDPRSCRHVLFRIVGSGGLSDSAGRFTIIW